MTLRVSEYRISFSLDEIKKQLESTGNSLSIGPDVGVEYGRFHHLRKGYIDSHEYMVEYPEMIMVIEGHIEYVCSEGVFEYKAGNFFAHLFGNKFAIKAVEETYLLIWYPGKPLV